MKDYALYKGEECLAIGTISEIAEQMEVSETSIRFYLTEGHKKRSGENARVLIEIEDDEE